MPTKKKTVVALVSKAPRKRRQRQKAKKRALMSLVRPMKALGLGTKSRLGVLPVKGLSSDSAVRWLQAAVAPRDFPGLTPMGVPDEFAGKSLVMRQTMYTQLTAPTGTTNSWNAAIIVAPIPSTAMFYSTNHDTNVPASDKTTSAWSNYDFGQSTQLFPSPGSAPDYAATFVNQFRFIGLNLELKQTGPALSAAGTISAVRLPAVEYNSGVQTGSTQVRFISGFDDANNPEMAAMPGFYTGNAVSGLYGWSFNLNPTWDFTPLEINTQYGSAVALLDGNYAGPGPVSTNYFTGWGNMCPLAVNMMGLTPSTSFAVVVEAYLEYQPRAGTILSAAMQDAPPYNPAILDTYKVAVKELPAFVCAGENAGFWDLLLRVLGGIAPVVGTLAGPIGTVIGSGLGSGLETLRTGLLGTNTIAPYQG